MLWRGFSESLNDLPLLCLKKNALLWCPAIVFPICVPGQRFWPKGHRHYPSNQYAAKGPRFCPSNRRTGGTASHTWTGHSGKSWRKRRHPAWLFSLRRDGCYYSCGSKYQLVITPPLRFFGNISCTYRITYVYIVYIMCIYTYTIYIYILYHL